MAAPKGTRPPGGSRKGIPNKTTASVKEALTLAFDGVGGVPALVTWAEDNRTEFYKLWGRLIPVKAEVGGPDGAALKIVVEYAGSKPE